MSDLRVGELQACDGEHDLPCGDEGVLRDLPGDVHVVGFHVLNLFSNNFPRFLTRRTQKASVTLEQQVNFVAIEGK